MGKLARLADQMSGGSRRTRQVAPQHEGALAVVLPARPKKVG